VTVRYGRRHKRLPGDLKEKKGCCRWKGLRTCRKTGYGLNECQAYSSEISQDDREKEKVGEVGKIYGTEQFNKR